MCVISLVTLCRLVHIIPTHTTAANGLRYSGMDEVREGDRVRIDIPDESDFDFEAYHGQEGIVVAVLSDDANQVTGIDQDRQIYRVRLEEGSEIDFRRRDLRSSFRR